MKKPYTHLIWDFNGTLLDDVDACIQSANKLLSAHSLPPLPSKEEYRTRFGFPVIDYYRRLGFDFQSTPYDELAVEWVNYYNEQSKTSKLFPDITEALQRVRANGITQCILSATEAAMLERQATELGIRAYFDELLGMDDIHAAGKTARGVAWREKHPDARVLFVGDTDHDAEVALAMNADCILLSCGHQPAETLRTHKVLCVLDSPRDVLQFLELAT